MKKNKDTGRKAALPHDTWISTAVFFALLLGVAFALYVAGSSFGEYLGPCDEDYISNADIKSLGANAFLWLIAVGAALVAAGAAYSLLSDNFRDTVLRTVDRNLKYAFIIVWIMGFLTYCVGTNIDAPGTSPLLQPLSVLPMSVIHATEMFLGQSDISAVRTGQHDNAFYMLFFNISHILAILCSMVFVLHQFGFYLAGEAKTGLRSVCAKFRIRRPKDLYIFWGSANKHWHWQKT